MQDLVIGTGEIGNSARIIPRYNSKDFYISENNRTYWVKNAYFDLGFVVFKDTEEGEYITNSIDSEVPFQEMQEICQDILLEFVSLDVLKFTVNKELRKQFKRGYKLRDKEVRMVFEKVSDNVIDSLF